MIGLEGGLCDHPGQLYIFPPCRPAVPYKNILRASVSCKDSNESVSSSAMSKTVLLSHAEVEIEYEELPPLARKVVGCVHAHSGANGFQLRVSLGIPKQRKLHLCAQLGHTLHYISDGQKYTVNRLRLCDRLALLDSNSYIGLVKVSLTIPSNETKKKKITQVLIL